MARRIVTAAGRASSGSVRVLHVITGLEVGGTETALLRLLRAWGNLGIASAVLTLRSGGALRPAVEALGVPVASAHLHTAPRPAALARTVRYVRAFAPHVIQGWLVHGNLAALAARQVTPRRQRRVTPVLWGVRAGLADLGNEPRATRAALRLSARLAPSATCVLYNAVRSAQEHEAIGYPADRRVIIPNGFDVERFRPDPGARSAIRAELGLEADAPLVGLLARDHPQKDLPTFLRAARRVAAARPAVRFVLAGWGVDDGNARLSSLIRELELVDRVRLVGVRDDTARLLAALDVATLCSRTEAFPNVVGEAMACGVAPVVTDVGDVRTLVGDVGTVVPVGHDDALAAAWLRHLDWSPQERCRVATAARARIVERFTMPVVAARYARLYREVGTC